MITFRWQCNGCRKELSVETKIRFNPRGKAGYEFPTVHFCELCQREYLLVATSGGEILAMDMHQSRPVFDVSYVPSAHDLDVG